MGLFSSVLHFHHKKQDEVLQALVAEIKERQGFSSFSRFDVAPDNLIADEIFTLPGTFYLITQPHGAWITVIEVAINIEHPVYIYEFVTELSERLQTYALSFHLHDDDVLYYNLEYCGQSLDGYNSNYQYFLVEKASPGEVLQQRHEPLHFSALLPATKTVEGLNELLNEGYWNAFDNNDLDENGVPNDDKYFIDEETRFTNIGIYLEIFDSNKYPFANWYENTKSLAPDTCYILHANT